MAGYHFTCIMKGVLCSTKTLLHGMDFYGWRWSKWNWCVRRWWDPYGFELNQLELSHSNLADLTQNYKNRIIDQHPAPFAPPPTIRVHTMEEFDLPWLNMTLLSLYAFQVHHFLRLKRTVLLVVAAWSCWGWWFGLKNWVELCTMFYLWCV